MHRITIAALTCTEDFESKNPEETQPDNTVIVVGTSYAAVVYVLQLNQKTNFYLCINFPDFLGSEFVFKEIECIHNKQPPIY